MGIRKGIVVTLTTIILIGVVLGLVYRQDFAAAQYIREHPTLFSRDFRASESGKKFVQLMKMFDEQPDLREAMLLKQSVLHNAWMTALMQTFDIIAFDEEHQLELNCTDGSEFCAVYRPFIEMVKNDPNTYIKKVLEYWTYQQGDEPLLFSYFDQIVQSCAETTPDNPYEMCLLKYESTFLYDQDGIFTGRRPTSEFELMDNIQHYLMYKNLRNQIMSAESYRAQVDSIYADATVPLLVNDYIDIVALYINVPVHAADARNDLPATFFGALAFVDTHPEVTAYILGSAE